MNEWATVFASLGLYILRQIGSRRLLGGLIVGAVRRLPDDDSNVAQTYGLFSSAMYAGTVRRTV
jgi:hypothetical protein